MGSELVINVTPLETRVALLENGILVEIYIEREKDRGIAGNIYKGKVVRILPGMQVAFVDIGLNKSAFLYVDDVFYDFKDIEAEMLRQNGEEERVPSLKKNDFYPPSRFFKLTISLLRDRNF